MGLDPFPLLDADMRAAAETAHEELWADIHEQAEAWGDDGRGHALLDMGYHAMFLAAALDIDAHLFEDYARWAARVLESRGVPRPLLAQAFERLADHVPRGRYVLSAGVAALALGPEPATEPEEPALMQALVAGDTLGVHAGLGKVSDAGQHDRAIARLTKAMEEVGGAWARNEISVADEHVATATCQAVLAEMRRDLGHGKARGLALLACVEGNRHDLGLRALADRCQAAGWSIVWLGADVATEALLEHIQAQRPDVVLLSAALPHHAATLCHVVPRLREVCDAQVYVGGPAFTHSGGLWRLTGADGSGLDFLKETA